ncbi:hypothetical protein MMYC01_203758 [Madurella mycetomatis]|uniref:Uncharacterized protein n=1 Tax=Madurella mycetomatis TaxID=100816 RepID=A0A175W9C9_9PEZI|nr:hypothetical protein MMYC01_203758 [Madurella mycetomatis]
MDHRSDTRITEWRPRMQYTRIPPELAQHAQYVIPLQVTTETPVCADEAGQDLRSQSSVSRSTLVGSADDRKRAHMQATLWLPEILSLIGGMLCLLCVTLNPLLAFLTSLAKAAFLVPIIEGLGQLKWMWFLSPSHRPLIDMQVFDEATRGGLGSLKLLLRFKG